MLIAPYELNGLGISGVGIIRPDLEGGGLDMII